MRSQLAEYLIQASKIGYGKTRLNVRCLVESHLRSNGNLIGSSISNGWWQRFLQRNPTVTVRSGNNLAGVRMDAVNRENIAAYFKLLRSIYDEHSFENYPECIYNMDETGVPLDPKSPKVIARKGAKKIHCRTSGQKAQITVIGSATGQALPPYLLQNNLRFITTYEHQARIQTCAIFETGSGCQ